jgi:predicted phage replisome organizer
MTSTKKYYWLKLKNDFFQQREIKKLRRIAGGDTYTIIYLKMQLFSIKHEGIIKYEKTESNFIEQLSLELDEDVDNIKVTLAYLMANNLIEEFKTDEFILPKVAECIGSETDSAKRVRKHRHLKQAEIEQKALLCNANETNSNTEIELKSESELKQETEIEQEEEKTIKKKSPTNTQSSSLFKITSELINNLLNENNISASIEEWNKIISEWIEYKQTNKKFKYGELGFKKFITVLLRIANNDLATAQKIIDTSICNGYSGIFEIKNFGNNNNNKKSGNDNYNYYEPEHMVF